MSIESRPRNENNVNVNLNDAPAIEAWQNKRHLRCENLIQSRSQANPKFDKLGSVQWMNEANRGMDVVR